MVLQPDDTGLLAQFNAREHLKYLESRPNLDTHLDTFVNIYVTECVSPSGKHIPLYVTTYDYDDPENREDEIHKGSLASILECDTTYAPCQDYVDDKHHNFNFLLNPKTY